MFAPKLQRHLLDLGLAASPSSAPPHPSDPVAERGPQPVRAEGLDQRMDEVDRRRGEEHAQCLELLQEALASLK